MSVALVATVAIIAFLVGFRISGVLPAARRALATVKAARQVIIDPHLDDLDKEKAVKKSALALFGSFISIFLRSGSALLISVLPILLADLTELTPKTAVFEFLARWDVISAASLTVIAGWLILRRVKQSR